MLLDLREVTLIADFFVICSGTSERQLKAAVERVSTEIKQEHGVLPFHTEGQPGSGWVLIDYSSVVVHVFSEEARDYYDLEGVWQQANVLLHIQ